MKVFNYIIITVPTGGKDFDLMIPYHSKIRYNRGAVIKGSVKKAWFKKKNPNTSESMMSNLEEKGFFDDSIKQEYIECQHIKPNTDIRYKIVGKWWMFLFIKVDDSYSRIELKTRGRLLWKEGWFSICSIHSTHDENCHMCKQGVWANLTKNRISRMLYKLSPSVWRLLNE